MAKDCVTEKTVRRQEWIENGLLELMQEKTFDEITVTDLCRHLALSRRSFYRYFRDLEDVLDALLTHTFQSMAITESLPELDDIRRNYEFWYARRPLLDALYRSGMIDKLFDYTMRFSRPGSGGFSLFEGSVDHELRRETGIFAIGGSVSLVIDWYTDGFQKTPEEMAKIAYRMLFQPLLQS